MPKISIQNSAYHTLLSGYLQHALEVFCGLQGDDIRCFTAQDMALQAQFFDRLHGKIRGMNFYSPSMTSGALFTLNGKSVYPIEISLEDDEKLWLDRLMSLTFEELQKNYEYGRTFLDACGSKSKVIKPFSYLLLNLRTPEAINFLASNFRKIK